MSKNLLVTDCMGLLLIIILFLPLASFDFLHPVIEFLHQWCVHRVQRYANQTNIHLALICGKKLPFSSTKQLFVDIGLIHIMIVSGAHLLLLEKIWNYLPSWPFKKGFVISSLFTYALIAQMHPPIVRALLSILFRKLSLQFRLNWSSYWIVMFSGIFSITLYPEWIQSTSLQLSWIGALAFASSPSTKIGILPPIMSYVLILPIVSDWHIIHPLSIGMNWLLFPVISVSLFPLSVLSFVFPLFYSITDPLWSFLLSSLQKIQPFFQHLPFYIDPIPRSYRWIYIVCIFIFLQLSLTIFYRIKKRI